MGKKKKEKKEPDVDMQVKNKYGLNPKQEMFCRIYSTSEEFFANGLQSYMKAYNIEPKRWRAALASSYKLLTNTHILNRVNSLLEMRGLNDTFVDKQLEFLITQNADFKSKTAAIREYNALKARITKKLDVTSDGKEMGVVYLPQKAPLPTEET